ncbi:MAG: SRPBCC domain-containing protein [Bacteroidota bacterium]
MSPRKVEASLVIKGRAEKIIQAFTDIELLKDWWNVEKCLINKITGGIYTLVWGISDDGFQYVSTGIIEQYIPDNILKIKDFVYLSPKRPILGPMTLEIHAEQRPDESTTVYLCQDGYGEGEHWDWYYNAVSKAWPDMLNVLKEYLEN